MCGGSVGGGSMEGLTDIVVDEMKDTNFHHFPELYLHKGHLHTYVMKNITLNQQRDGDKIRNHYKFVFRVVFGLIFIYIC